MKYLLVLLVVIVVLSLLVGKRRGRSPGRRGAVDGPEGMVRCVQCGLHLPLSEAVQKAGRTYCSTAHLEQDVREP